jgi:ribosomal protein L9
MVFDKVQCEEFYPEDKHVNIVNRKFDDTMTFISSNMLIVARVRDGKLFGAVGTTVKAEAIEMNTIKVEKKGETLYYELGDKIKWLELEL